MKKNGMIIGEVLFALFACGILMGISIYMFKSNDVTKTPFVHSVLKKLPEINAAVMEQCYKEGSCTSPTALPDSTEEYCARLADIFATTAADCTSDGSAKQTINGKSYAHNFRLTNGVSFYNMNPSNGWSTSLSNNFIDAFIDVDGAARGDNELGADIFPIRIFKNGEVIPSVAGDYKAYDDEEFFAYRVILDRAVDENNPNYRAREVVDVKEGLKLDNEDSVPLVEKVSFQAAVCVSNPGDIKKYYTGTGDENVVCDDFDVADTCNFTAGANNQSAYIDDPTAFCTVEPVRPRGSGVFKIFGI